MLDKTKLANSWPWQYAWIAFAFWVPNITGLTLVYLSQSVLGKYSYWLLGINVWGVLFAIIYTYVSKRVKVKKQSLVDKNLSPCDGLISFGKLQAPAAIAATPEKLYFAPIVGKELSYEIQKIKAVEMKSSLPGKNFLFKVAFHITLENDAVFGFAVNIENAKIIKPLFGL